MSLGHATSSIGHVHDHLRLVWRYGLDERFKVARQPVERIDRGRRRGQKRIAP